MSGKRLDRPDGGAFPSALDPASRRAIAGFAFRLTLAVTLLGAVAIVGGRPFGEFLASLRDVEMPVGVWVAVFATARGERPDAPSLNYWDEAVAHLGVCALADLGLRLWEA